MCLDLQRYEMDSHHFLVLVLLFMLQFNISLLFQMCGQCRPEQCPLHIIREGCGRGREIELDECSCCPRCTRSESESCGGMKQLSCSPGLYCAYRPGRTFGYIREGVCEPCKSLQDTEELYRIANTCTNVLMRAAWNVCMHNTTVYLAIVMLLAQYTVASIL